MGGDGATAWRSTAVDEASERVAFCVALCMASVWLASTRAAALVHRRCGHGRRPTGGALTSPAVAAGMGERWQGEGVAHSALCGAVPVSDPVTVGGR